MNKKDLALPIAVIAAGLIIAGSIFVISRDDTNIENTDSSKPAIENTGDKLAALASIRENDHVLGDPEAEVVLIEYSDFQCPYCQSFQETMNKIMVEYADGKVAWVYRHYWPRQNQYHPLAGKAIEASECVAELAGNQKFWEYSDLLFANAPKSLSPDNLAKNAAVVGVDEARFAACLDSGKYATIADQSFNEAYQASVKGTPFSIVYNKTGRIEVISGAQPYANVKLVIDTLLES